MAETKGARTIPHQDDAYTHGESEFADRILADPKSQWPVRPGRYRVVVSLACPWASRSVVVRRYGGGTPPTKPCDLSTYRLDPLAQAPAA